MLKMFRALLTLAPLTVLTVLTSLAQAKVLAVVLGPSGLGFFFLAISFLNLMTTFAALGASASVTKLVAEYGGAADYLTVRRVILLALGVVTSFSAAVIILLLAGHSVFHGLMLGGSTLDANDRTFILGLTAFALFPTAWNLVMQASLRGLRNIRSYARASSISLIVLLLATTVGAWAWGARGALVGSVIGQFLSLASFALASARVLQNPAATAAQETALSHSRSYLVRRLIQLGTLALVAGLAGAIGQNTVRSFLTAHLSLTAVAFFGAAWSVSNRLPLLIYQTFSAYTIPRISSFGENWERIGLEQNHALRLSFLGAAPLLATTIVAQNIVIPILFSKEFLPMGDLMKMMLVGELLSILFWVMSLALYPTGRAAGNATAEWSWWALFVGGVVVLADQWGLESIGWAYVGAYAVMATVLYAWQRTRHGFRLTRENVRLLVASVLLVATAAVVAGIDPLTRAAIMIAALITWSTFALSATERSAARRAISALRMAGKEA